MAFVNFFSCNDPQFLEESLLCNFIEIILRHGCSPVNFLRIFTTPFLKNTSGQLLLIIKIFTLHVVTARVPSFIRVTDKFGYISYSHFFYALAVDSGRLETLETLLSSFPQDSLLIKMKSTYRKLIHLLNLI